MFLLLVVREENPIEISSHLYWYLLSVANIVAEGFWCYLYRRHIRSNFMYVTRGEKRLVGTKKGSKKYLVARKLEGILPLGMLSC